jgi:hypothetical protein
MTSEATTIHWIRKVSDERIELLSERNPELCFERNAQGDLVDRGKRPRERID